MKRPRGAWRRGTLLSLLLVGQMLLAGCSFEARLQRQADGRYAEEATIALSSAELRSVGGEAVVEQYLDLVEQSFVVLGGSYRWWKEPTGDGVRFRIQSEAAQPAGNLAPLASFSQSMVTWQSTPDGQWRLQQSIDLTGADLQAAGGEALLDQSFNQACGAQLFGEMCQWWKVPIGSGVRYTMSIGGAAWDPSQVLIPGLPPLPGLQPDGLEEPEAELPAAVSPSDPEARRWLDEKSRLIPSMEVMDIPADPFSLPAVAGYDEAAARDLLQRIRDQLDRGQLAVEQLEAFKRLTIQERSLSQMLPPYAGIEASIADTLIDTVETLWGLVNVLGPLLDGAKAASPIVDAAADKVLEKSWELIRDVGRLAVDVLGSESDQRETASKAWDMGLRLIEDRYFGGMSLLDLLKDNVVEIAVTTALIQPYRSRMQALLDRGVRTADLTSTAQDRWPISGTTQSAEYLSRSLVDRAGWEREAADTRHQDFQRGVDVLKVAEDVTALATLTPLAALAKIVNIGAGVEHMLVNVPELLLNGRNAECVDYV